MTFSPLHKKRAVNMAHTEKLYLHYSIAGISGKGFQIVEKAEIRFWHDQSKDQIHVIHIPSGRTKILKGEKRVGRFLQAYQVSRDDCKRVRRGNDRLGLFKRKWLIFC